MLTKLERLLKSSKTDETKLDRIESHIAQLRENMDSSSSNAEVKPMLMTLLAEEEKVFRTIARDRILNCLSFEGMSRRSEMVVETHADTYEWILENDSTAKESATEYEGFVDKKESDLLQISENVEKVRARDKLRAWLESETSGDVFHLSGKLGSGKSTLMKHIMTNPRTEEKLNKWAGKLATRITFQDSDQLLTWSFRHRWPQVDYCQFLFLERRIRLRKVPSGPLHQSSLSDIQTMP